MQAQSSASSPASSSDALSFDGTFLLASSSDSEEQAESDESDVFLPAASSSNSSSNSSSSTSSTNVGGGGASGGGGVAVGGGPAATDGGTGNTAGRRVKVKEEEVNESASDRSYGSQGSGSTSAHHRAQHSKQSNGICSISGHHRGQQSNGSSRGQQSSNSFSTSGQYMGQQWKDTTAHKTHGDLLFSQKCAELQGFIRPLLDLLKGIKRGRFDHGLSRLQQTVAMDRIQRIVGVLQRPNSGEKYLTTILKVETMLKHWFPQVPTNSVPSSAAVSLATPASSPPDLSQLQGGDGGGSASAPASPAASPPLKHHRDQRHIPVKKRRLSWTGTDSSSPSTSPVPAKRLGNREEDKEEAEEEETEGTREKGGGETLSSTETDPGRDGQMERTERSIKEERTEIAVHV